jgi:hypothetical protein
MAAKINMLKLLQEMHGFAGMAQRHAQPKPAGLVLMQLRSHLTHTRLPRTRRSLVIDMKDLAEIPHPVRITYLDTPPASTPRS